MRTGSQDRSVNGGVMCTPLVSMVPGFIGCCIGDALGGVSALAKTIPFRRLLFILTRLGPDTHRHLTPNKGSN